MARRWVIAVMVAACAGIVQASGVHREGFEVDAGDWVASNTITRVASGTGGIPSASGGFHAELTNLHDGYMTNYGNGGHSYFSLLDDDVYTGDFFQAIDVYIDVDWAPAALGYDNSFWIDMAGSRDHDPNDYGTEQNFRIKALGPGNGVEVRISGDPAVLLTITQSGWYTFEQTFEKVGAPTDPVTQRMNIYDASGAQLATKTVTATSPGGPTLNSELGGSGYVWITLWQNGFAGDVLRIDNVRTGVFNRLALTTSACAAPGGTLTVTLSMSDMAEDVVGGQFFLEYDDTVLNFVSADAVAPFGETYEDLTADGVTGLLDFAVNAPFGHEGVGPDADLATFTFAIADIEVCSSQDLVRFRDHTPPNRLTMFGGTPINPQLVDLGHVVIDDTPPDIVCDLDKSVGTDPGVCSAVVTFAAPTVSDGCEAYDVHFEGFEDPGFTPGGDNWNNYNSAVTRVASGNDGITSAAGGFHAVIDSTTLPPDPDDYSGLFSRLGGYSSSFGNGFTASVDVYLDLSDPAVGAEAYAFDLSVAASNQAGEHLRDFIFHAAGYPGEILIAGSNNSNFQRRNDLASLNHHPVTSSGWYTFEWVFRDAGDGSLAVDLNLRDAGGTLLWTETRNSASDVIATVVGGNRYMWFTFLAMDELAIDNTRLTREGDPLTVACVPPSGTAFSVGSTVVTCTAEDACNTADCTLTVTVTDNEAPQMTCPADVTTNADPGECSADLDIPAPVTSDNCGVDWVKNSVNGTADASGVYPVGTTQVTWTVADVNGNDDQCVQTITVIDNQPPAITCPDDETVDADMGTCGAEMVFAVPVVSDNCGVETVVNDFTNTDDASGFYMVGTTGVTWTVVDTNGLQTQCTHDVEVVDNQPPVITDCPDDIEQSADAGGCDAEITWTPPTITDNCSVTVTPSHGTPEAIFPAAGSPHTVSYDAVDPSGNAVSCTFDVTVNPVNDLLVDVELSPSAENGPFTRCITFEFFSDCPGSPAAVVNAPMTFTGGVASGTVQVACGAYECLTAQDKLHTLRRTDENFGILGTAYVADFTDDVEADGDWLVGGNLNGDPYVDILDFGLFSSQYVNNPAPGANTSCPPAGPHADINGNGVVGPDDFSFIQINFLAANEDSCCDTLLLAADDEGPVVDISIAELQARGLGHLAVADLNADGRLNEADVAAFYAGVRPQRPRFDSVRSTPRDAVGQPRAMQRGE